MPSSRSIHVLAVAATLFAGLAAPARGQMNTQHVRGSFGLKAGSSAPPGEYYIAPLLYFYSTDDIRNKNGDQVPINANIDAALFGAGVSVVTKKTILGATYGFTVLIAGANNRLQATEIDANPGAGITDSVVTPLSLGWHKKRADAAAYYTLYVPTGRYEDGASNNTGLGMWGQEIGFGTTAYLTEDRKFHAATMVSFNFQSKKEDSQTHVGNQMNFEGGIGGDFLKGGLTAGLSYYYCFKLTRDEPANFPLNIALAKANVFALGPDITLALASKKTNTVYGFVTVRYFWEVHAEAQTKGGGLLIQAVFPFRPIHIPTP
jgi:hypothetical protein